MTIDEIVGVLKKSGVELYATDDIGNPYRIDDEDVALMFHTMARDDLNTQDKAFMLAGILAVPPGE